MQLRSSTPPPRFMSWINLAFDNYLRRRACRYTADLSRLRCPSEKGLVSIVLPVYNGQDYLREALDSILAQTYPHFELVAIDDGSTDQTGPILDDYRQHDPRVRVVHQENRKLPAALNAGFELARGEFLTWTSADNRLAPNFLEKLVADLQARPAVDMIYANYDIIDGEGHPLNGSEWCIPFQTPPGSAHIHVLHDVSILNLIDGNYIGAAFLYRDRVAHLVGPYDPARFSCEDYDFFLRVNESLTLRHAAFEDCIYEYRIHEGSLSAREKELSRSALTRELMLFDDFRRDLVAAPLGWRIEAEAASPRAQMEAQAFRQRLAQAGHFELARTAPAQAEWTRWGCPGVLARFTENPADPCPGDPEWPASLLKVLVYLGTESPPAEVDPAWEMCITTSPAEAPPRLDRLGRGWFAATDRETLWSAIQVRALAHAAAAVGREIEFSPAEPLQASVVICTYRRAEPLLEAVRSACRQDLDPRDYEIIVVNNDPATDLTAPIESLRQEFFSEAPDRLRLVACPIKGLSLARNAGLAAARGRIVAFLDDDAAATPDWLRRILADFAAHPEVGVVGGPILLDSPRPRPAWFDPAFRKYWSQFEPPGTHFFLARDWREFPYGANWSARRDLLLRIGGFRARYGRGGPGRDAGEETVAAILIERLGARIGIDPEARVDHYVDPGRFTPREMRRAIGEGWRLRLSMESDGYLGRGLRPRDLAWGALKKAARACLSPRMALPARIEELLHAQGMTGMLWGFGKLQFSRLKKPRFRA